MDRLCETLCKKDKNLLRVCQGDIPLQKDKYLQLHFYHFRIIRVSGPVRVLRSKRTASFSRQETNQIITGIKRMMGGASCDKCTSCRRGFAAQRHLLLCNAAAWGRISKDSEPCFFSFFSVLLILLLLYGYCYCSSYNCSITFDMTRTVRSHV